MLRSCLRFLDLEHLHITPSSMRAGGTTFLFESGMPVGNIRYAGRWSSESSMAAYIQEVESSMVLMNIPASTLSAASHSSIFVVKTSNGARSKLLLRGAGTLVIPKGSFESRRLNSLTRLDFERLS